MLETYFGDSEMQCGEGLQSGVRVFSRGEPIARAHTTPTIIVNGSACVIDKSYSTPV